VFGDSTVELTPLGGALKKVSLDADGLQYKFVGFEGKDEALPFESDGHVLTIDLGRSFDPGEKIAIRIKYSAKPTKGVYFVDELREKGKTVRSSQIWTQGESEETHHWLPSFDFPDDRATTEQILTVDKGETAIANGKLVSRTEMEDGSTVFHWKMDTPHSLYLTSFVIGKYTKVSETYRDVPLGYYVYPGQESIVPLAYGKTKKMFAAFEKVTGVDYPFDKYDQTIVGEFQFGGMENITSTTMADSEIMLARFPPGRSIVEDLVSHELAHSWFGNLVTCRNWAELWLNEGFATFMEAVFREHEYGRANYDSKIKRDAAEYMAYESLPGVNKHGLFNTMADAENDDSMFDTITYQKGGSVVHTLREELGDEKFWKGVNLYLTRSRLKNVETEDLKAAMEEVSGRDLKWFFEQWVYAQGFPKLTVIHSFDPKSKELTLKVSQTQKPVNGVPQAFRLPLEVKYRSVKGLVTEKILVEKREQTFTLPAQSSTGLQIDPSNKIPLKMVSIARSVKK